MSDIEKKETPQAFIDHDIKELEYQKLLERLNLANKAITYIGITKGGKTTNYAEVKERIKAFRIVYPRGGIMTKIVKEDPESKSVIVQATVYDEFGSVLGQDYASETLGGSYINKTSMIENCSTSAVGRALGLAGFGIEGGVASAEEVKHATAWRESEAGLTICHRCGRPIRDTELYPAERIAKESMKMYGDTYCMPCLKELKDIKVNLEGLT